MAVMRHPQSGATYRLREDGNVDVENNGMTGVFASNGRYLSGEIRQADPHFILWLAGPQLPPDAMVRVNR